MELVRHINRFHGNVAWDWNSLSVHPSVNLQVLKSLRDKPWNWSLLTKNRKFVWMWVQEFPDKAWDWNCICRSDLFSWNWIREFPKAPWNWNILSDNIVGVNTLKEFPDEKWNWYKLTLGPRISPTDMVYNPNFPWTINELLFVDVDEEIIRFLRFFRSHYDQDAWKDHTCRASWKIIRQNMDLPWILFFAKFDEFDDDVRFLYEKRYMLNWNHLSEILDFSSVIYKCPDLPWNFMYVSKNKTVTYRDVLDFPNLPWDHSVLCLESDRREWNAANTIKKFWKRCVTDPAYQMCRKVVLGDLMSVSIYGNNICEN
jgi:hypothetical protein